MSVITASRALRGSAVVAEKTSKRVAAAAAELKYAPNLLARWLVEKRSRTIGVIIHEIAYPFFEPIVGVIEETAAREDFLILIAESRRDVAVERKLIERFRQLRVAGIAIHPASNRDAHLAAAQADGTPVVAFARPWADGDFVAVDNRDGGRQVARHLLSRGHSRIGLVTSEDTENVPVHERVRGFLEGLAEVGVQVPPHWRASTNGTSFDEGRAAADTLLGGPERPTAVFCVTDRLALGVINRLLDVGIDVPNGMAVTGFDNLPHGAYSQVPLTTVTMPVQRMGELVAQMLFGRVDGRTDDAPQHMILRPELVLRRSSP